VLGGAGRTLYEERYTLDLRFAVEARAGAGGGTVSAGASEQTPGRCFVESYTSTTKRLCVVSPVSGQPR
jgi:hypothetical protein